MNTQQMNIQQMNDFINNLESDDSQGEESKEDINSDDLQYIYITEDRDGKYVLRGCKTKENMDKLLGKRRTLKVHAVYPTIDMQRDKRYINNEYNIPYNGFERLESIKNILDEFYDIRDKKYKTILKERLLSRLP